MRAAIFHTTGGPEVLQFAELPTPVPAPDEVLVRVQFTAVQPFDTAVRRGWMPTTAEVKLPIITGNEFAGEIAALGDAVTGFAIGQRVAGRHTFGCAAQYLAVPVADIAVVPETVGLAEASYLGGSGQTAHMAVEFLAIGPGDTFLVHGAAGGVGSIAVQLGRLAGAKTIGTGSASNQNYIADLGAIPLVYGDGLRQRIAEVAPQGISMVLDCAGGEALDISIELVANRQRIATLADYQRYQALGVAWPTAPRNGARLAKLLALVAAGQVRAPIRRIYPFAEIAEAHRAVEAGHGAGKVVVRVE